MADLTAQLDEILQRHHARLSRHRKSLDDITDEFLKDAYKINSHLRNLHAYLREIRQPYLSTSPPPHRSHVLATADGPNRHGKSANRTYFTDAQRDQIDAESKATLRDLNAGIRQLEEVERIRRETRTQLLEKRHGRNGFWLLNRWAAGGTDYVAKSPEGELDEAQESGLKAHRESVIWYLRRQLGGAAETQREMMETRIEREIEKSKSVLYMAKDSAWSPGTDRFNGSVGGGKATKDMKSPRSSQANFAVTDEAASKMADQGLTPEQMQIFEEENNDMLRHYEDTLDQVRTAERSMVEISELQTTLAQNLEMQSTRIDHLVDDSANTELNVAGGNKQLKKASERFRPAQYVFYASCGLSAFLILWDLII